MFYVLHYSPSHSTIPITLALFINTNMYFPFHFARVLRGKNLTNIQNNWGWLWYSTIRGINWGIWIVGTSIFVERLRSSRFYTWVVNEVHKIDLVINHKHTVPSILWKKLFPCIYHQILVFSWSRTPPCHVLNTFPVVTI